MGLRQLREEFEYVVPPKWHYERALRPRPVLVSREEKKLDGYRLAKRSLDIALSLGALVFLLPVFAAAAPRIAAAVPGVQFVVARAPSLSDALFADIATAASTTIVEGQADDVIAAADAVVTASGTATVQTAIHGKPMVIVYRLSRLTYAIARRFVKVSTYGMVNLIAGRTIVPELIQDDCTPENVAREAVSLLTDRARMDTMRADVDAMRLKLGGAGASERAARAVLAAVRA